MPKKLASKPIEIKVEKDIELPPIFQMASLDKYKFSELKSIGMSVFIPLEGQKERNLRQNLFQHIKKARENWGMELVIRKMTEDPDDPNSQPGFRVWRVKPKKEKR